MFEHLQIPYREERLMVGLADAGLGTLALMVKPFRSTRAAHGGPQRILLLRLERIGDLLMVLDAIGQVRVLAPHARIDLVVGSWNAPLAKALEGVDHVDIVDAPWMSREGPRLSWGDLVRRASGWRANQYDLVINFEPDIRSNLLAALSGARRRVGFISGGGRAFLTTGVSPDPKAHIAANARALVGRAFELGAQHQWSPRRLPLVIPEQVRREAAGLLGHVSPGGTTIGIQPAAGRQIKEWDPVKFAEVGAQLARSRGARVVLIGSKGDKPALDAVRAAWPLNVPLMQLPLDVDLLVLAAVLERLRLFISGDTGPMHLAAAVGTPVLAIFGPSLPTRYAPLSAASRIVRIDIACSPCNLMRKPPTRCVGHVPDCLAGIDAAQVIATANEMLDSD